MTATKILLTGATGEIGRVTLVELLSRGDVFDVRLLVRPSKINKKLLREYRERVDIVWGDLMDGPIVDTAVAGRDVVIHAAGVIPPASEKNPTMAMATNYKGTKNIVAACERQSSMPKLVFTSSVTVYGDRLAHPEITVNDPLKKNYYDIYAETKILAEQAIRESALTYTILRLSAIMRPNEKMQPIMFHVPLDTMMELCTLEDTAFALVEAVHCEGVNGRIFNLGGGPSCRVVYRDLLARMMDIFGVSIEALPENAFALHNFNCGYLEDSGALNELLAFQRHSLDDFLADVANANSPAIKWLSKAIPNSVVRLFMATLSPCLWAVRKNDTDAITRFYGSKESFRQIPKGPVRLG